MPLIDDQTRTTDRRATAVWPWVLVVAALCLIWIAVSVVVSFSHPAAQSTPTGPAIMAQFNQQQLQQAEQSVNWGQWQQAAAAIQAVDPSAPMSLTDKHRYLRLGGRTLVRNGSPLAGARYYARFLSMAAQIHRAECRECHNKTTQIAPMNAADMEKSQLGRDYRAAVRAAGKLRAEEAALQARLRKDPNDVAADVLLFHVETSLDNKKAAAAHAKALADFDAASAAKQ